MGSVEYAWARIAARQSRRPGSADWHRVEAARSLAALLDAARGGVFEPWLAGLDAREGPHAIDAHFRSRWRDAVSASARWMPEAWQPAIAWWAWLPDLPLLDALARGRPLPDAVVGGEYREVASAPPSRGSRWAPLASAWREGGDVGAAWLAEWHLRLPAARDETLGALELAVRAHFAAFRSAAPGSGAPSRAAFAATLRLLFRRATAAPAAVFVFLLQLLLDGERLRGELARRAALPQAPLAP